MMQHPEWLEQPLDEWIDLLHAGLMFDYVAIRDIEPGEEIFLDYGDDWATAWDYHVANWKPPEDADRYIDAVTLNEREQVMRTVAEGHYTEEYNRLLCRGWFRVWSGLPKDGAEEDKFPCRAVFRYQVNGEDFYTAEIYEPYEEDEVWYNELSEVLLRVPRDAFVFEDRPYSRE
jgi:hypothetical protein